MDDKTLILAAIKQSGLSTSRYAREILIREPRTLRRWITEESPIPQQVREFLETELAKAAFHGGPLNGTRRTVEGDPAWVQVEVEGRWHFYTYDAVAHVCHYIEEKDL